MPCTLHYDYYYHVIWASFNAKIINLLSKTDVYTTLCHTFPRAMSWKWRSNDWQRSHTMLMLSL